MIDQTKELAAMAAKRATRAALLDAQAALKAAKTKFEESRSDCVNNAQNEKKCKDINDAVTKASSDVLRKQERYNRAEQMLAKYKSSLSNDMTEFTKQRQAFFKEHEKMQDHLESEIQRCKIAGYKTIKIKVGRGELKGSGCQWLTENPCWIWMSAELEVRMVEYVERTRED